ncbi:MAG: pancreas/duodenum homeobox protein 1 [Deltaproteobacteria bacterium]|nr:pancreas/duodenum homeobox protein 1 [Deltaproteobacteria bacterium]MBW2018768.1 pancreas/duodenum homeobox protein 1 [Deltaproteobacteria bacterium]MBW2073497.1 pancreas/duodenum homeobox protein 1 [Deltaproteobacteria bacterium]RLB82999.1 MAG: pancreas/duodenum homeobox protein 1 [Deltaproteobacteria bacterium]
MATENHNDMFTRDVLQKLFPPGRADQFFDALYGDATEGAFDIALEFKGHSQNKLQFEFHLKQRPDKCLACHLTFGLPEIFSRHPIINTTGLVQEIEQLLNGRARCTNWQLGMTQVVSSELHVIPLTLFLDG